jgi:hypothetical protein
VTQLDVRPEIRTETQPQALIEEARRSRRQRLRWFALGFGAGALATAALAIGIVHWGHGGGGSGPASGHGQALGPANQPNRGPGHTQPTTPSVQHSPVTVPPPLATSTTTTTAAPAATPIGPTLATCIAAVTTFYEPPFSWNFGGSISADQGVAYGCENQLLLSQAMMSILNANVTLTPAQIASGDYETNSNGQLFAPNGDVINLYQDVCNVEPESTLCVNG